MLFRSRKVFKCDFCDGDPQCVRFCDMKAVDFVDPANVSIEKKRSAAERISKAAKEAVVLTTQM